MLHVIVFSFLGIVILYHHNELKKFKKFLNDNQNRNKIKNKKLAETIEQYHDIDYK